MIYFSGSKGFHVGFELDKPLSEQSFKNITYNLARDLPTYDDSINNPSRILRLVNTKHQGTGLFKIQIEPQIFTQVSVDEIRDKAKEKRLSWVYKAVTLPEKLKKLDVLPTPDKVEIKATEKTEIDFTNKMKGWSNCKWAILNGFQVKEGDRHNKLLTIIATCKALNVPKKKAYYMAKGAMEDGVELYGGEKCEKEDIWRDVESVYDPGWKGGTYSCRDGKSPWLTAICQSLGHNSCKGVEGNTVSAESVFESFSSYAENYEKNVLQTGIEPLDEKVKFMVGTSNGILAPPGVGKTSLVLSILNHNSKNDIHSIFFSYDMFHSMVYIRMIQRHFGYSQDEIFHIYKHNKKKLNEINEKLKEEYKNVHFCFKSGQTLDEMYETIVETEQKSGHKIKLTALDYNELVTTNVSDPTQSSAMVAQRRRQIANDTETCGIDLLQPAKIFSNPADEIVTYQGAKGSGAIAQSLTLMLSLSRPGFSPRNPENDKYLTINALKNRNGGLFTIDLGWTGLSGQVRRLTMEEEMDLSALRTAKAMEKGSDDI
jgi:hypothetical protein